MLPAVAEVHAVHGGVPPWTTSLTPSHSRRPLARERDVTVRTLAATSTPSTPNRKKQKTKSTQTLAGPQVPT